MLDPAMMPSAGPWTRWHALQYLHDTFSARLAQERALVVGCEANLTSDRRELLWALGELLETLRQHLDHLVGLCHQANQFADVTGRLLKAFRHWCRAVEAELGPLPVALVPAHLRETLRVAEETAVGVA